MNNILKEKLKRSSPLYDYWRSDQSKEDEKNRICKLNQDNTNSYLFKDEPYKWEVLYQSTVYQIYQGDNSSIYALKVLLSMVKETEREIIYKSFLDHSILDESIISQIQNKTNSQFFKKKDYFRFTKILFSIFFNPFEVELKSKKSNIYEWTGAICLSIRKIF